MESEQPVEIRAQKGPQEDFLKNPGDIVGLGGSAGGGKTFAELLEMVYHVGNPRFRGLILRRTLPMLKQSGGLLDASYEVYRPVGGELNLSTLTWKFPSGAVVQFDGCEHESNRFDFMGSQFDVIAFDELTQFPESIFWYLQSRLRGTSGIKPSCKFTCNPDCDHFLRRLLAWWIDDKTGLAIRERSGLLRWFIRVKDELHWADTPNELLETFGPDCSPKSLTFIPSSVFDNKILMEKSPGYVGTLRSLPLIDRARLLDGDWNARPTAGSYFKRSDFAVVDAVPAMRRIVRSWDRASTEKTASNSPDWTRGLKVSRDQAGMFYVEGMESAQARPSDVEKLIVTTASQDGREVEILLQHDPGSAGVAEVEYTVRALAGYTVHAEKNTTSKEARAGGASTQAGAGNIKLLRGAWNEEFLQELSNFPVGKNDDIVDGLSAAINRLASTNDGAISGEMVEEMKRLNAPSLPMIPSRLSRFPTGLNLRRLGM